MTRQQEQAILEKLKRLPAERVAEVEDFIDFLRERAGDRDLTATAMIAAAPILKTLWDNPDDAEYDRL